MQPSPMIAHQATHCRYVRSSEYPCIIPETVESPVWEEIQLPDEGFPIENDEANNFLNPPR